MQACTGDPPAWSQAAPVESEDGYAYSRLVSPGSYLIVEDTGLDGIPIYPNWEGPTRAVMDFLGTQDGESFGVDSARGAFMTTLHPGGWLRRK